MSEYLRDMTSMIDTFFNGRKAPERSKVTLEELIRRKVSHVLVDGQLYKVEVTPVEIKKAT